MKRRGLQAPLLTSSKTASDLLEVWQPHPGPQTQYLLSEAFELLYGGQAGGGKTVGLVACAALQAHLKDYAAILFRKTYKQIGEPGGLEDRTEEMYFHLGANYKKGDFRWIFPSTAEMVLRHLQHKQARYNYQGAEYGFIGFDQLEQFAEDDYLYLFSRARSVNPRITSMIRNTANPGAEWVLRRWLPWLGTDAELQEKEWPRAKPGELLYFKRENDVDILTDKDDPDSLSRTFIPATVYDNPTLMENDPDYIRRLKALPFVERERLLNGNWHIREVAGNVFKMEWWGDHILEEHPPLVKVIRAFDLAGTEKETISKDPDYTATVKMGLDDLDMEKAKVWLVDAHQDRLSPLAVENLIYAYHATEDMDVVFVIEQEPGQAGKAQVQLWQRRLKGRHVIGFRPTTDKVARAGPFSTILEAGGAWMLRAPWNGMLINHLSNFPSPDWHDDLVDATSMAYYGLIIGSVKTKVVRLG